MTFRSQVEGELGFVPGAIAVMGKWEPFMRGERCLEEVAARAAAALALVEALDQVPGPFLISAEGKLRGQPRPGCVIAAEILVRLGAQRGRVRCWPGANQTWVELQVLDRMRRELGAGGLALITAGYHVGRTHFLIRRLRMADVVVIASDHQLVREALVRIDAARARRLEQVIVQGLRNGMSRGPVVLNEAAARLGLVTPGVQQLVADLIRGRARPGGEGMFCPDLPPGIAGGPLDLSELLRVRR